MPKIYSVKEIYFTLQGEGANTGRAAVFLRFSGCNLWSGREQDRAQAVCSFCDTDFVGNDGEGGGKYDAEHLVRAVESVWQGGCDRRFVVCTGGEPLLQLDQPLIDLLHAFNFEIAVETNGTIAAPEGIDWITVSPKAGAPLEQTSGSELKLVYPQPGAEPHLFENLRFDQFFIQPMDGPHLHRNTQMAIEFCKRDPKWKLSLQTHKMLGIP
jgi:7-carboxy-7-deazaguanine synthase (Cx14CxxC type)